MIPQQRIVCNCTNAKSFEDKVNSWLAKGWRAVPHTSTATIAMVQPENSYPRTEERYTIVIEKEMLDKI